MTKSKLISPGFNGADYEGSLPGGINQDRFFWLSDWGDQFTEVQSSKQNLSRAGSLRPVEPDLKVDDEEEGKVGFFDSSSDP